MKKKLAVFIVFVLFLSSCAKKPNITVDELQDYLAKNEKKVLEVIDSDDGFNLSVRDDKLGTEVNNFEEDYEYLSGEADKEKNVKKVSIRIDDYFDENFYDTFDYNTFNTVGLDKNSGSWASMNTLLFINSAVNMVNFLTDGEKLEDEEGEIDSKIGDEILKLLKDSSKSAQTKNGWEIQMVNNSSNAVLNATFTGK